MKKCDVDYTLYLCTDRDLMSTDTLEEAVTQAIEGGCTVIQLREKDCSSLDFYRTALNIREITRKYHIPFIINDRVDIALAVDADGVHVGQSDLPAKEVRRILGPDKILGVSAARLNEAKKAVEDGADYLGVGAMFPTGTKTDARPVTGGINLNTMDQFKDTGIDGLAVVSAVIAADDIKEAAKEMVRRFRENG